MVEEEEEEEENGGGGVKRALSVHLAAQPLALVPERDGGRREVGECAAAVGCSFLFCFCFVLVCATYCRPSAKTCSATALSSL